MLGLQLNVSDVKCKHLWLCSEPFLLNVLLLYPVEIVSSGGFIGGTSMSV